ncbi:N-acetylglucosamine-1-phosphotransferase subunits alpha/beta-like [Amphibalanus amphitrite]|uniref:N-acetylglucosamine-1-phosphotransferase subunits alpha/beta-like n=1 Tax=Amphibalanus amphitrite TaxID=1232801 RepID=UPI001C919968|nr:N-acetylglucosamine-1-phosphotransferase subunits alpha/beta-like [Amphibalanus amphitrite]XP_043196594.1 N-acetylglucosamine-1-phosphotransferase subunits alpha/beta-like [Amphibalanus amphitrite]XP_043196595.1 N-acetylglucosamine-1-phosphotransferase subunits alpha/beta-like [Amphibalanus amphitrite]XP_043196596.1 N-acetylglucosamine-1-phosphotransferase subunits alpha/beta-like [Amphibalanus amphitrite]XP_043196597.1 N-acetylglucosamine-1-phosphotransferase subunits alpha/beta-like [Amphi
MAKAFSLKSMQRCFYDTMSIKYTACSLTSFFAIWLSSLIIGWLLLGEGFCPSQPILSDNLFGFPVPNQPFPIHPVDVVYTWVNGSDPQFQRDLHATESHLQQPAPASWRQNCPLPNCLLSSQLSVVPPLPRRMTLSDVRFFVSGATPRQMFPSPLPGPPATLLVYASVDEAQDVLQRGTEFRINEDNFTVHQMFWTWDESAALSAAVSDHVVLIGRTVIQETFLQRVADVQKTGAKEVARADDGRALVLKMLDAAVADRLLAENGTAQALRARLMWLTDAAADAVSLSRFADSQELRYSLRSLERHAPWVRRVFLVTNGQIPDWLALDNPKLTLVTHEEIFPDHDHLPTFSSPAIEAHIHRIPGLSEHFLYFNDDVLLGQPVWPEDFLVPGGGYNVFLAWRVPDCALDCSATWLRDGHCDAACNTESCDWDAGDCVGVDPNLQPSPAPDPADEDVDHNAGMSDDAVLAALGAPELCSTGCEDAWLGDHFCDTSCDVAACAYDLGDCGVAGLRSLPDLGPLRDDAEYVIPTGSLAVYWNASQLPEGLQPEAVSSPPRHALRGMSLTLRFAVLVAILRPNATLGRLPVFISGTVRGPNGTNEERMIEFYLTSGVEAEASLSVAEEAARLKQLVESSDKWNADLERRLSAAERRLPDHRAYMRQRVELLKLAADAVNATIDMSERILAAVPSINRSTNRVPRRRLLGARPVALPVSEEHLVDLELGNNSRWEPEGIRPISELSAKERHYLGNDLNPVDQLDTYGLSLLKVNRLYNRRYGPEQRRAVAHMPHLFSRAVIADLQATFADEFARTSAARLRSGDDMQFAFAYFYFLMSERDRVPVGDIFDTIDTDDSGTWSDREIRTLLTKLRVLPLTREDLDRMWALLRSCAEAVPAAADLTTPPGERYLDSNLPVITKEAVLTCPELTTQMERSLGNRTRYPHRVVDASELVSFTMVRSNSSLLVGALDSLRRAPRKFICLNNNVGAAPESETRLVYALLVDFLEALFPRPSQFELPANYRNRFQHVSELREWERQRSLLRVATVLLTLLLLASLLHGQLWSAVCRRRRRAARMVVEL